MINNIIGITAKDLQNVFIAHAIDNLYLNRDRFNDAIKSLFSSLNLPILAHTYLTERVFDRIDFSGDGSVNQSEFMEGMAKMLSDPEFRRKGKICYFYSNSQLLLHCEDKRRSQFSFFSRADLLPLLLLGFRIYIIVF